MSMLYQIKDGKRTPFPSLTAIGTVASINLYIRATVSDRTEFTHKA